MKKIKPASYNLFKNPYQVTSLDISTGHLTKRDNELLKQASKGDFTAAQNPIVSYEYEYGYFVFVPPKDEGTAKSARKYGYSEQFTNILNRARALKCKYIQYDGDGIQYDDLKTYNW